MVKFNLKKKIAKALVFAMVMGTVGVHGSIAAPKEIVMADEAKVKVEVDYTDYTAVITATENDKFVFLEVLKDEAGSKISGTYCYSVEPFKGENATGQGAIVDLSFLKANKVQYLRAYGDAKMTGTNGDAYSDVEKVNAQPAKFTIKYAFKELGKTPQETFVKGLTLKNTTISKTDDLKNYEYRTLYGSKWEPLEDFDVVNASVAGTTILIRKEPDMGDNKDNRAPVSAEVKVKIAAIPKAPKVTIDYVKGTVKLPKNAEIAVISKASTGTTVPGEPEDLVMVAAEEDATSNSLEFKSISETAMTPEGILKACITKADDLAAAQGNDFVLVVRTNDKKKAASGLTFIEVKSAPVIEPAEGSTTKFVVKGETQKSLEYKNTTKGIELSATGTDFDYSVDGGNKWKTIKAGSKTEVKLEDKAKVAVRVSAVKPTKDTEGVFASETYKDAITCQIVPATVTVTANVTEVTKGSEPAITLTVKAVDGNKKEITLTDNEIESVTATGIDLGTNFKATTISAEKVKTANGSTIKVTVTVRKVSGSVEIKVNAAATTE